MDDLRLDPLTHDLVLVDTGDGFDLDIVSGVEAVEQGVKINLLSVLGENPWDLGHGLPWFDGILNALPEDRQVAEHKIRMVMRRSEGVVDLSSSPVFSWEYDTLNMSGGCIIVDCDNVLISHDLNSVGLNV